MIFYMRKKYVGRERWTAFNKCLIWGLYGFFVIFIATPLVKYAIPILLVLTVILSLYFGVFQYHMREMERKRRGQKGFGGWCEHEHGLGEKFKPIFVAIYPINRLSETDLEAVNEYIAFITEQAKERVKLGVKDKLPPQKQLTYEEFTEEEDKEYKMFLKDYKHWKEERQDKIEKEIIPGGENDENKNKIEKETITGGENDENKNKIEKEIIPGGENDGNTN